MSEERWAVSLVKRICPVCGHEVDSEIILPSRLTKPDCERVRSMHGKVIGFSDRVCEKCRDAYDKSRAENGDSIMYAVKALIKDGKVAGITGTFVLIKRPFCEESFIMKDRDGVRFAFCEEEAFDKLFSKFFTDGKI